MVSLQSDRKKAEREKRGLDQMQTQACFTFALSFSDWQTRANEVSARAERISRMIRDRARDIGERELHSGREFAFVAAHNWYGQKWMTPRQNKACRQINHLMQMSFQPHHLASRINSRMWEQVQR